MAAAAEMASGSRGMVFKAVMVRCINKHAVSCIAEKVYIVA